MNVQNRFILSDSISAFGDRASEIAFLTLAYQLSHSAYIVASVALVQGISYFIAALVNGAWAHAIMDRRRFLIGLDVLRAVILLCCCAIHHIALLYICVFTLSLLSAIYYPIRLSGYQTLIASEDRIAFISRQQTSIHVLSIASPLLAAWVITSLNLNMAFYVDALSFIIASLILCYTPRWTTNTAIDLKPNWYHRTLSGFSLIFKDPNQKNMLYFRMVLLTVLASYQVVYIFMITESLDRIDSILSFGFTEVISFFATLSAFSLILGSYLSHKLFSINQIKRGFLAGILLVCVGCFFWVLQASNSVLLLIHYSLGTLLIFLGVALMRVALYSSGQEITSKEHFAEVVSASDSLARTWQYSCGAIVLLVLTMSKAQAIMSLMMAIVLLSSVFAVRISAAVKEKRSN